MRARRRARSRLLSLWCSGSVSGAGGREVAGRCLGSRPGVWGSGLLRASGACAGTGIWPPGPVPSVWRRISPLVRRGLIRCVLDSHCRGGGHSSAAYQLCLWEGDLSAKMAVVAIASPFTAAHGFRGNSAWPLTSSVQVFVKEIAVLHKYSSNLPKVS